MVQIARALIVMFAASLFFAPQAAADQDEYLRKLESRYPYLSSEQLTAAGNKVCNAIRQGIPASNAAIMVREDLGVSVPVAGDIVSAAVIELGC
ncbi:DUF732 domain-containing protein [Mycolicibacterium pulveris]|uniref:DUF732 domain-containing protein n=1 Tax=Mycolicibacterium pulveris TaxID=36813 RepID=UPI003CE6EA27